MTALPAAPQTLAAYLAGLALTDRPAIICRKIAAIAVAHRDAGLEAPIEQGMMKRISRGFGGSRVGATPRVQPLIMRCLQFAKPEIA